MPFLQTPMLFFLASGSVDVVGKQINSLKIVKDLLDEAILALDL